MLGLLVIYSISLNVLVNLVQVALDGLKTIYSKMKELFLFLVNFKQKKNFDDAQKYMVDRFGGRVVPKMSRRLGEKQALKFCKSYHKERMWCL